MTKIISYAVVVLCFFTFCSAEAAIFGVANVTELQSALTTAQSNAQDDTINLAPGTYSFSSRLDYFPGESESFSLTIQGAGAGTTILDGGNSTSILRIENGAVLDGTNTNVAIRGVTFQNGNENLMEGGALYIGNPYAQTTIEDSVFQNNTAVLGAGALYLDGGSANIARNTFTGNSSTGPDSIGGALYTTILGGPLTLNGNMFSSNVAGGEGGGAYVSTEFGGSLTLSGNTFTGNSGSSAGGAFLSSQTGPAIISGNIFKDNIASTSSQSDGGGVAVFSLSSVKMVNNLFTGNRTSQRGAGAMISIYSNQNQITNNTFVGNSSTGAYDQAGSQGGGMYVVTDRNQAVLNIYNNIFWGNTAAPPSNSGADAYINDDGLNDGVGSTINLYNNDFSNIEIMIGDHLSQGGNINGDPMLDPDYRLTVGSPCMDTGSNSAPQLPATDLGGNPRKQDGTNSGTAIVDMGAYERGPTGSLQVTISPQGAINAGAKWRVDGGAWHSSGDTQTDLSVGRHTVEFSNVAGWTKPGNRTVTISNGQTANTSGIYMQQPRWLVVTIIPQGAINAGAQWRVDGGVWRVSGYAQTVSVGQHTVEFSDVTGWTKPANQAVTISDAGTTLVTGNYILQAGFLQVTISPQEAIDAGAQWRVQGEGGWHVSGDTEAFSEGQHTIEFSDVAGWTKPGNQTVTISEGQTATAAGNYTLQIGSLQVAIIPQEAITAGAQWRRVGTTPWLNSGATEPGIPAGLHTVEFSDVPGWAKPSNQTVTISDGQTTTITGTYMMAGSLQVAIIPQEAITAGAQWRRVGTTPWLNSGATEPGIPVGQHTVEFSDVTGWTKPASQAVTISNGQTTMVTGTYTQQTGALTVTISPQGAIDAGAKWHRIGTSTWRDSGATETGIPVGQYTVEFSNVSGWTKPGNQTVTISDGQTTNANGIYTPPSGSLRVTMSPQGAIDTGAQWRADGGTWHGSGDTQIGLSVGMHTVEFSNVAGWTKPGNRTVTVSYGQTATTTGTYTLQTGSLRVIISPQGAINAGAQWRRAGTSTWRNSGATESGIPVGQYSVEFKDLSGWTNPVNLTVTISNGQTTTATGTYTQQTGSLTITISPQGAIGAGAKWRRAGTSTWRNSGATEAGVPVGQYTVEFSNVAGWIKPGNQTVTVSNGQTTNTSGTYTLQTGSLRVTISPTGAINAGAQWRVDGGAWHVSGDTQIGLPIGQHTVEFFDVTGWTKPANQTVTISNGQTMAATGTYTLLAGSLRMTISPTGAINAGAQWRRSGTNTWRNSGTTETAIPVGQYGVEFKDVSGWTNPGILTVTISNGQTTIATATYAETK